MFLKKVTDFIKGANRLGQKRLNFYMIGGYKINEKENVKVKGDGQPYINLLDEEYIKMTTEEKKEVAEIGKKLNRPVRYDFCLN